LLLLFLFIENALYKAKEKFVVDSAAFYPVVVNPILRPLLSKKINQIADHFKSISENRDPTTDELQEEIRNSLDFLIMPTSTQIQKTEKGSASTSKS